MTAWKTSIQRTASQRFLEMLTAAAVSFAATMLLLAVLFASVRNVSVHPFRPEPRTDPTQPPDDV